MAIEFIKLVLHKRFEANQGKNLLQDYHEALDKFIFDLGGCFAGWDIASIETDKSLLAYSCVTENRENDVQYLNVWIKDLQTSNNVNVIDKIASSGEMIVTFEDEGL